MARGAEAGVGAGTGLDLGLGLRSGNSIEER